MVIRSWKAKKDKQYNGQKTIKQKGKKTMIYKAQRKQKIVQHELHEKGVKLGCSGRAIRSCSTIGRHCLAIVRTLSDIVIVLDINRAKTNT